MLQQLAEPMILQLAELSTVWEDGTVDHLPDEEYYPEYLVYATEQDAVRGSILRVALGDGVVVREPYLSSFADAMESARYYRCTVLSIVDGEHRVMEQYPV